MLFYPQQAVCISLMPGPVGVSSRGVNMSCMALQRPQALLRLPTPPLMIILLISLMKILVTGLLMC